MNQTQRESIKERVQKRREYLRKVTTAGIAATVLLLLSLGAGAVVYNNLTGPHWDHCLGLFLGPFIEEEFSRGNYWLGFAPILTVCGAAAVSAIAAVCCRKRYRVVVTSPYVPPIRDQVSALPAEILLRSSDQPAASSEQLLRAAHKGNDSVADELLRPGEANFRKGRTP